jgi:asparagine synthase (glutamine-hydrolysing)
MCGIYGVIGRRGRCDAGAMVRRAVGKLRHRGPDGEGTYTAEAGDWVVGLGHTRLAVVELTEAGAQPMASADGRVRVTYNGEIYNHGELRKELRGPFRGHSDTETLVAGLAETGAGFVRRLRGMYGFGALEEGERRLRIARDPLGIKPLYYHATEELFVFGSEVRAVMGDGRWRLSRGGVRTYLETGSAGEAETILEGIRGVEAGEELEVDFSGERLRVRRVGKRDVLEEAAAAPATREEAVEGLRGVLAESVSRHLMSDVPVGVFLSGGIDSSALVGLLRRAGVERPRTFTVTFGRSLLSESVFAKRAAAEFGTEHREVALTEAGLLGQVAGALGAMDQPTVDGVNSYVVSGAVRGAGLKVALTGLGGDELFAGYPSFRRQAVMRRLGALGPMAGVGVGMARRLFGLRGTRWEKLEDGLRAGGRAEAVYRVSRRLLGPEDVRALTGEAGTGERGLDSGDGVNAISRLELGGYMRNTLLRDCDGMSMAHGLEVRTPFVDVEVARYVLGLPGRWKLGGRPKGLLLDAAGEDLPEEVWRRKKMGFTLPFAEWMRGELRAEVDGVMQDRAGMEGCGVRWEEARRIWTEYEAAPERWRWSRPWSLYVLAKWTKENGVTV